MPNRLCEPPPLPSLDAGLLEGAAIRSRGAHPKSARAFSSPPISRSVVAGRSAAERIVGTGGVGVAGDDFSGRLVDHVVAPALGKGTRYRTAAGGLAHLPAWIFGRLRRWQ